MTRVVKNPAISTRAIIIQACHANDTKIPRSELTHCPSLGRTQYAFSESEAQRGNLLRATTLDLHAQTRHC
jgi:hypothetical protein